VHVGSPHPLKSWRPKGSADRFESSDVHELVTQLHARAQKDADAWKGEPQTYQLLAYFGGGTTPGATFSATYTGRRHGPQLAGSSMQPTYEGALALMMRHADNAMQRADAKDAILLDVVREQRGEVVTLRQERGEVWAFAADLAFTDRESKAQAAREAKEAERWDRALSVLGVLLPSIVNKLAGSPLLPETTSPLLEQFRNVFSMMSPEHVEKLSGVFGDKPEIMIAITDVFSKFIDDSDKRKALATLIVKAENAVPAGAPPTQQQQRSPLLNLPMSGGPSPLQLRGNGNGGR
jgi:hypothetical protein